MLAVKSMTLKLNEMGGGRESRKHPRTGGSDVGKRVLKMVRSHAGGRYVSACKKTNTEASGAILAAWAAPKFICNPRDGFPVYFAR